MFPNLLIELKKQRCSQQDLARHIGISRATMDGFSVLYVRNSGFEQLKGGNNGK